MARERIRTAIPQVQSCGMSALAKFAVRSACQLHLFLVHRYDFDLDLLNEQIELSNSGWPFSGLNDDGCLQG